VRNEELEVLLKHDAQVGEVHNEAALEATRAGVLRPISSETEIGPSRNPMRIHFDSFSDKNCGGVDSGVN